MMLVQTQGIYPAPLSPSLLLLELRDFSLQRLHVTIKPNQFGPSQSWVFWKFTSAVIRLLSYRRHRVRPRAGRNGGLDIEGPKWRRRCMPAVSCHTIPYGMSPEIQKAGKLHLPSACAASSAHMPGHAWQLPSG